MRRGPLLDSFIGLDLPDYSGKPTKTILDASRAVCDLTAILEAPVAWQVEKVSKFNAWMGGRVV